MTPRAQYGWQVRLSRVIPPGRPTLLLPLDDALINGPTGHLSDVGAFCMNMGDQRPDSILGFPGSLALVPATWSVGRIVNVTASTTRSRHTKKVQVCTVEDANCLGADALAVHVNITSKYESEMLEILGAVVRDASKLSIPVLAIMYPRKESSNGDDNYLELKQSDPEKYAGLVAHCCRVAVELGAAIVKTQFTGSTDSFRRVVDACQQVPVLIAGGKIESVDAALNMANAAIRAGARGISFGRNVHQQMAVGPAEMLVKLRNAMASII